VPAERTALRTFTAISSARPTTKKTTSEKIAAR
jgi:hypothetical protein